MIPSEHCKPVHAQPKYRDDSRSGSDTAALRATIPSTEPAPNASR